MPFVKMKGIEGMVWEPEGSFDQEKKHPCPDCYCCAWCSDERCKACLASKAKACNKSTCKRKSGGKK